MDKFSLRGFYDQGRIKGEFCIYLGGEGGVSLCKGSRGFLERKISFVDLILKRGWYFNLGEQIEPYRYGKIHDSVL